MTQATKQQFLKILEREYGKHAWATDTARLERAMEASKKTLDGSKTCMIDQPSFIVAWRETGHKGKPTYKALHALPNESEDA